MYSLRKQYSFDSWGLFKAGEIQSKPVCTHLLQTAEQPSSVDSAANLRRLEDMTVIYALVENVWLHKSLR